jgi:hypothetical protein
MQNGDSFSIFVFIVRQHSKSISAGLEEKKRNDVDSLDRIYCSNLLVLVYNVALFQEDLNLRQKV